MNAPSRIEGYAIVSDNGMIATAKGAMARTLKFDADQEFFEQALNGVDVVVHGRHSRERHRRSDLRRRMVLTRRIPSIANYPNNRNALFWNPAGATLEQVLAILGTPSGSIAGGTERIRIVLDTRARGTATRRKTRFSRGASFIAGGRSGQARTHRGIRGLLDAKYGLQLSTWSRP
jgi:hypothetical protein